MTRQAVRAALVVACGTVLGCRGGREVAQEPHPADSVAVQIDSATAARNATLDPGVLATVAAIPVERLKGPGEKPFEVARRSGAPEAGHSRQFGTITLPIALRSRAASINQFPCTSCHLGRRVVMARDRIKDAHNNIQPLHPGQTGQVCSTCHSPDDVALLTLKGGQQVTLDESYRLCAQCHFLEARDWAGGAHGKRLDGWQGRRVIMACADCHDPHNPAVQPRVPFRAPTIERIRGHLP